MIEKKLKAAIENLQVGDIIYCAEHDIRVILSIDLTADMFKGTYYYHSLIYNHNRTRLISNLSRNGFVTDIYPVKQHLNQRYNK